MIASPWIPLSPGERALLEKAGNWPGWSWAELTPERIRALAAREGIDFATAVLYDRLRRSPEHGPFIADLEAMSDEPAGDPRWNKTSFDRVLLAVAPGAFHRERPETGADGRFIIEQAARVGCRTVLLPLHSFARLHDNARIICDWLARQTDGPIVLVSLSKSGAEVALALRQPDAAGCFAPVAAWVNLSGLVRGTPMVTWLFQHRLRALFVRLMFWYRGWSYQALRELARGPAGLLDGALQVPGHIQVVHLFGFPLAKHLSRPLARRGFHRIAPLGPNDGGSNLLSDSIGLPGLIYPVWGADHYLRPGWDIGGLIRRLLHYLVRSPAGLPRAGPS